MYESPLTCYHNESIGASTGVLYTFTRRFQYRGTRSRTPNLHREQGVVVPTKTCGGPGFLANRRQLVLIRRQLRSE